MTERATLRSPPRPRLGFRVGIVGHRPDRLKQADLTALQAVIREILVEVKDEVTDFATSEHAKLYADYGRADHPPILRAISPLAEGTDRLFAEVALLLGFELCCPMPFAQAEFEQDFLPPRALEPDSVARFRGILKQAEHGGRLVKFELDGSHDDAPAAYAAGGRVVLNQSDLLVVVWDGKPAAGRGGTVDTLREAVRYHVPVVWVDAVACHVDAVACHRWGLLESETDLACLASGGRCTPVVRPGQRDALRTIVHDELAPPKPVPPRHHEPPAPRLHHEYFRERRPSWNPWCFWKLFRNVLGDGRLRAQSLRVREFESQVQKDWPTTDDHRAASWVNAQLRPHYAWSDKLADLYADRYRSGYVLVYLLAALAVVLALLPGAAGWAEHAPGLQAVCVTGELLLLGTIISLVGWGRHRHWHERWLEYRLAAELIRQLRCLVPLGGGRPFPHVAPPAFLADYGDVAQTWMYWLRRAVARATGIPTAVVTRAYVHECITYIKGVVEGQVAFHDTNATRATRIKHRLHRFAFGLLVITVVAVVLHLLPHLGLPRIVPDRLEGWLTFVSGAFPALGAALAGIENQGEFTRIAKRSGAMAENLRRLLQETDAKLATAGTPAAPPPRLDEVAQLANRIAQLMVDEVADWRVVFADRPQPDP